MIYHDTPEQGFSTVLSTVHDFHPFPIFSSLFPPPMIRCRSRFSCHKGDGAIIESGTGMGPGLGLGLGTGLGTGDGTGTGNVDLRLRMERGTGERAGTRNLPSNSTASSNSSSIQFGRRLIGWAEAFPSRRMSEYETICEYDTLCSRGPEEKTEEVGAVK